ncbi:histidine kinase [Clostridium sp. CAG:813]|nr:histidine kinase [Clostridium sp. CAG:813]
MTEKQAKYIKIINSNSNDLYHFMDKLLEFTESESSLYKSMYQNFDVVQIIKGIASEFEKEIQNKKISFEIEADGLEKRTVYSDLKAVEKIVRNILETSVSMTETGFILVNISRPDEVTASTFGLSAENISKSHVQITLKDTGVGFAEDEMKFLCDPYAQLEKGKKNFVRSLNLGSASILTKRANGFINIQSEANKGTRYDIIFPAEKD